MTRQKLMQLDAPLEGALSVIGDMTSVSIVLELMHGKKRFSELNLGVSSKTLSSRLKRLERNGIISRTLHAEVPPRVEYALTEKGVELLKILEGIFQWEQSWK